MSQLDLIDELERRDSIFRGFLEEGDGSKLRSYSKKNLTNSGALFVDKNDDSSFLDWLIRFQPATLEDIRLREPIELTLPRFIPCVDLSDKNILTGYNGDFLAVSGSSVLHNLQRIEANGLHNILGVKKRVKLILRLFARDDVLEIFSKDHHKYLETLVSLGIDIFLPANFSIVRNNPVSDQVVNAKRSLWEAVELSALGANVIPHIFWANIPHMRKIAKRLLTGDANIKIIAIDLGQMGRELFEKTLGELTDFKQIVGDKIEIVVSGPSTINRIEKLRDILGDMHLINSQAAKLAKCGKLLKIVDGKLRPIPQNIKGVKSDIFHENIKIFKELVQQEIIQELYLDPYNSPSDKIPTKLRLGKAPNDSSKIIIPSWVKSRIARNERG